MPELQIGNLPLRSPARAGAGFQATMRSTAPPNLPAYPYMQPRRLPRLTCPLPLPEHRLVRCLAYILFWFRRYHRLCGLG